MYTVLLVDDEIWSLEGLKKIVDWQTAGFRIIGESLDSSEAMSRIVQERPDVVFIDIRMPGISGIELLRKMREQGVTSEFIVVSGYAEFEYAKQALRHGAFDYQLKPMEAEDAQSLLGRLREHLDYKRREQHGQLYQELLTGTAELLLTPDWSTQPVESNSWLVAIRQGRGSYMQLDEALKAVTSQTMVLQLEEDRQAYMIYGASLLSDQLDPIWRAACCRGDEAIGVSGSSADRRALPELMREAEMAVSQIFITNEPSYYRFSQQQSGLIEGTVRSLERLLIRNRLTDIDSWTAGLPKLFHEHGLGVYHAVYLWNQLAMVINRRLHPQYTTLRFDPLGYDELLRKFRDLREMMAHISLTLEAICNPADNEEPIIEQYNEHFVALLQEVTEHYERPFTLRELAEKYYLNMSYCSELFKKATGYTFSDYVTKLRMEKALELLQREERQMALPVWEQVGYNDYYYFCRVFKNFHGITPSQLKKRGVSPLTNKAI